MQSGITTMRGLTDFGWGMEAKCDTTSLKGITNISVDRSAFQMLASRIGYCSYGLLPCSQVWDRWHVTPRNSCSIPLTFCKKIDSMVAGYRGEPGEPRIRMLLSLGFADEVRLFHYDTQGHTYARPLAFASGVREIKASHSIKLLHDIAYLISHLHIFPTWEFKQPLEA